MAKGISGYGGWWLMMALMCDCIGWYGGLLHMVARYLIVYGGWLLMMALVFDCLVWWLIAYGGMWPNYLWLLIAYGDTDIWLLKGFMVADCTWWCGAQLCMVADWKWWCYCLIASQCMDFNQVHLIKFIICGPFIKIHLTKCNISSSHLSMFYVSLVV